MYINENKEYQNGIPLENKYMVSETDLWYLGRGKLIYTGDLKVWSMSHSRYRADFTIKCV